MSSCNCCLSPLPLIVLYSVVSSAHCNVLLVIPSSKSLTDIYITEIDGVVCPPNISETDAGTLVKLAHRQRIASTTIKLILKRCTVHFITFSKNNSANRRWPEAQIIAAIWFGRLRSKSRSPCPEFGQNDVTIYCALRLPSLVDRHRSPGFG